MIAEVRRRAEARGLATAVVTFDRHPASVVRPESAPRLLTDLDQKLELLAETGVDYCLVITFDEAAARNRPRTSCARSWSGASAPGPSWSATTSTSGTGRSGNVDPAARDGCRAGLRGRRASTWSAPTDGRPSTPTGCRRPASATPSPRVTWRSPTPCSAGPTRSGAWWPAATSGAVSWAFPPPTCRCRATSCCRPTASTPAGTSGPTASVHPTAISLGRRPDVLRRGARQPARGPPPRLLGRPVRRARQGAVRGLAARRGQVRLGRRADRPDRAATATRPAASWAGSTSSRHADGTRTRSRHGLSCKPSPLRAAPAPEGRSWRRTNRAATDRSRPWPTSSRCRTRRRRPSGPSGTDVPRGALLPVEELPGDPGDPIEGPGRAAETDQLVAVPRLARHEIVLDDDHKVGVAVCGRGLPVVLVHGFTAEGILYAQTLSRLVGMGFKVVAVDVAGHGATQGLPTGRRRPRVLHAAAGPGPRRARHPPGRVRRPLDGRPARDPARRPRPRPGDRGGAHRRGGGRLLGPADQGLALRPAGADRAGGPARGRHPVDAAVAAEPGAGRQARAPHLADPHRPRHAPVAHARARRSR